MNACLLALIVVGSPAPSRGSSDAPWLDGPAFSVPASLLMEKALAVQPASDAEVVYLLNETRIVLDAQNRATLTRHRIYRVLEQSGVDGWANVYAFWSPWHQGKPAVRARVVGRNGVTHELDVQSLIDSPLGSIDSNIFSDRHILQGPLPAVGIDSVVEVEITITDHSPRFTAGIVEEIPLFMQGPVLCTRVWIDAPSEISLHAEARLLPDVKSERTERDGRVHLRFEQGVLEKRPDPEVCVPYDVHQIPHVTYSTARSWNDVAQQYAAIVDERLAGSELSEPVTKILSGIEGVQARVAALVGWLHQNVRYTGLEFGEAEIVPAPPAETLRRGYGDCKDKSTLLVALLRAAGHSAHIALMRTGPDPDVDPEFPGMGAFDHAIVRVAGEPEIWIDATAEHLRSGELPVPVEGRLTLVAAPESQGLVHIPEALAKDNRREHVREIFLTEFGPARVVETMTSHGYFEDLARSNAAASSTEENQQHYKSYAEQAFMAKKLIKCEWTPPKDFSAPFQVHLEMGDAELGSGFLDGAMIGISRQELTATLGSVLIPRPGAVESGQTPGTPPADATGPAPRKHPFRLPLAFVQQWTYKVHSPPGFGLQSQFENRVERAGPVTLTQSFAMESADIVNLTLRLDTGTRIWSPAELESVQVWYEKQVESEMLLITYDQIGNKHLEEGRIKESVEEFRRLRALHPQEALHHVQLAIALQVGGVGVAARSEAHHAVDLEPRSALAWRTLGWVMMHDIAGRQFRQGCDLAEAERACRKAKELDNEDEAARTSLAQVLEYSEDLVRYGDSPRLEAAIAEWRTIRDDFETAEYDANLMLALAHAGRFTELYEFTKQAEPSDDCNAMRVVAVAALSGAESALEEAARLAPLQSERTPLLAASSLVLLATRHYPETSKLLQACARGLPDAAQTLAHTELLSKCRRIDPSELHDTDPIDVIKRFFLILFGRSEENIVDLFARSVRGESDEAEFARSITKMTQQSRKLLQTNLATDEVTIDVAADLFFSLATWRVEEDANGGSRVTTTDEFLSQPTDCSFYLVQEKGHPRVVTSSDTPGDLGLQALRLLDEDKAEGARKWLNWARKDVPAGGEDALEKHPFHSFWPRSETVPQSEVRLAAAVLAATASNTERAIPILQAALEEVSEPDQRLALDCALFLALAGAKRVDDAGPALERLQAARPDSPVILSFLVGSLIEKGKFEDIQHLAERRLMEKPGDPWALRLLAQAQGAQGDFEQQRILYQNIVALGRAVEMDYNNLAWNALVRNAVDEAAIEAAKKAALFNEKPDSAQLHTLAALYAEVGRHAEAVELMQKVMEMSGNEEPDENDWYLLGRLAENLGETAAAIDAYRKVGKPERSQERLDSCYALAQRRLAGLAAARR